MPEIMQPIRHRLLFLCLCQQQLVMQSSRKKTFEMCKCSKYLFDSKPIKLPRQSKFYYCWSPHLPCAQNQNQSSFCSDSQPQPFKGISLRPLTTYCLPSDSESQFEVLPVSNHSARQYKMLCVSFAIFSYINFHIHTYWLLFFSSFFTIILDPIWYDKRVPFVRILRTISFMCSAYGSHCFGNFGIIRASSHAKGA